MYQDGLLSYAAGHWADDKKEKIAKQLLFHLKQECPLHENWPDTNQLHVTEMKTKIETLSALKKYAPDSYNEIISYIYNLQIVESPGIKNSTMEHFEKLLAHLSKFSIINVGECISFSSYVMTNGQYNHLPLTKCMDFAYRLRKQLNIGALIFYKNMPDWIRKENFHIIIKKFVLRHLHLYVHDVATHIKCYEKNIGKQIVTSIELLREPLNTKYDMDIHTGYASRGSIYHHTIFQKKKIANDKNTTPGWFKYISLQDVGDLSQILRNSLPNTQILITECNLEDRRKTRAFIKDIVEPLQELEAKKHISIFDAIGCLCHCDTVTIPDDIICLLETLSETHKPIKICEFDQHISFSWQDSSKDKDLHMYKSTYIHKLVQYIQKHVECVNNLQSFSLYSVNDIMNDALYMVKYQVYLQNQERASMGIEPITTVNSVYGGYYDQNMNERIEDPDMNQNRGD